MTHCRDKGLLTWHFTDNHCQAGQTECSIWCCENASLASVMSPDVVKITVFIISEIATKYSKLQNIYKS